MGGRGYSLIGLVRYVPLEGMVFKVKQKNIFYLRQGVIFLEFGTKISFGIGYTFTDKYNVLQPSKIK